MSRPCEFDDAFRADRLAAVRHGVPQSPRTALAVGAIVGLAAGLLVAAPWAGSQGEEVCQPAQVVTDGMLGQLQQLNRKLDKAIEDAPRLRLPEELERIRELRALKHDLIRDFPTVFGLRALHVYSDLQAIDYGLNDAVGSSDMRGPLRIARDAKDELEATLRESPCRPR